MLIPVSEQRVKKTDALGDSQTPDLPVSKPESGDHDDEIHFAFDEFNSNAVVSPSRGDPLPKIEERVSP